MKKRIAFATFATAVVLLAWPAAADDGPLFQRNVSKTPDLETDHATVKQMKFYVPAQQPDGDLVEIEYLAGDCTWSNPTGCEIAETLSIAKPLVAFYHDGEVVHVPDTGFPGHGQRDVHAAVSLDDGSTWKRSNLSRSGDLSSFTLRDGTVYYGDTFRLSAAVAGNRVMVAWASRYCRSGSPAYSLEDDSKDALLEAYPELANPIAVVGETEPYELYVDDLFGVSGAQKSIDFADEDYPTVGEVPYACLWVARGTLEPVSETADGDVFYDFDSDLRQVIWRSSERVTSGVRDVHRIEVHGANNAGFVVTWQEDPDGLRPGKGLGPGAGWSGAIAHQQTDIWYTHIAWDHFADVCLDEPDSGYCLPGTFDEFTLFNQPKAAVPMAMPVRITDNASCVANKTPDTAGYVPYCYADFNSDGTEDLCASSESWTSPGGTAFDLCFAEDGRPMDGRLASTRARVKLQTYSFENDDPAGNGDFLTSAWVMLAYEKLKGLGTELDAAEDPMDIGKDIWYHSFDMLTPEMAQQGLMLNPPAVDPETGEVFPLFTDEWGNDRYETEIARRASLITQGTGGALRSENKTVALVLYKQGILNQGGPADIFGRFFVLPDDFDTTVDNPFAFENMACVEIADDGTWTPVDLLYADGSNPNYVEGLCPVSGINLSATSIVECDDGSSPDACVDSFPWPDGDGLPDNAVFPKVTEWLQTVENFNDLSWDNPYDVAKGHRGYMDGDFIMLMYGWSPNWKATSLGQDGYNLYVRRSFDGGMTWTTLPASYTHIDGSTWIGDGTTHCEWYGWGGQEETEICTDYGPADFEQARNLTQFTGSKLTLLDPRFVSTKGDVGFCFEGSEGELSPICVERPEDEIPGDIRNPSRFFATYQTGDNSTVTEGEATPLDMYYSRAVDFGDDYEMIDICADDFPGNPSACTDGESIFEFDGLEKKKDVHSAEATLASNPAGTLFYAIWNQWKEDSRDIPFESDAIFRRIFYVEEDVPAGTTPPSGGGSPRGGKP